jgi:hypothetical protein
MWWCLRAGGIGAERAGSGDSLNSLPKLQPVHRLAKPDLKIEKRIGEGAFGEVSVAKAPLYGTVAVKWLKVSTWLELFDAVCSPSAASAACGCWLCSAVGCAGAVYIYAWLTWPVDSSTEVQVEHAC